VPVPAEYGKLLHEFVARCEQLVQAGAAYMAVILCHELYRFLYPVEPYAAVEHDDPIAFAEGHIARLVHLAEVYADAVVPYPQALEQRDKTPEPLAAATSGLYSQLWVGLDEAALVDESRTLLEARLPAEFLATAVAGARGLDVGCGSGRYTIALATVGAGEVVGVDFRRRSFAAADELARQRALPVTFVEADVLALPFEDESFDFVFCNGVLHHSESIERGLAELARVLKPGGRGFLYLYGAGGIFWETRRALRPVFERIPLEYTQAVLALIGMPPNRFIFCDTWYVPVEAHTSADELHAMLERVGFQYEKVPGRSPFDLDGAIDRGVRDARAMWGDGEHRYLLTKPS
jgi:ubiquinone/menaquinone biosynthesis C-methylase UbiE